MTPLICGESESIKAAIGQSLSRLGIECATLTANGPNGNGEPSASVQSHDQIIFFGVAKFANTTQFETIRRLRSLTDKAVVVVGPPPDQSALLNAMRAGATDYLVADAELDQEIAKFVSRTQSTEGFSKGRLITLVPCHAPCDGSVLAANMAAVIAQRVGKCCLVDLHLRGGDLALLLKVNPRHTIYDLCKLQHGLDEAVFQQALTEHPSGIRLVAGPPMFSDLKLVNPAVCQRLVSLARCSHPFVLVNCEDTAHAEQLQCIMSSDDVVLVTRLDLVSLNRAKHHVEFIVRHGAPRDRIHIAAMGTGLPGELPTKSVTNLLGAPVSCVPSDEGAMTQSINVGNPLVLETPRSAISKAIAAFTEQLTGVHKACANSAKHSHPLFGMAAAMFSQSV